MQFSVFCSFFMENISSVECSQPVHCLETQCQTFILLFLLLYIFAFLISFQRPNTNCLCKNTVLMSKSTLLFLSPSSNQTVYSIFHPSVIFIFKRSPTELKYSFWLFVFFLLQSYILHKSYFLCGNKLLRKLFTRIKSNLFHNEVKYNLLRLFLFLLIFISTLSFFSNRLFEVYANIFSCTIMRDYCIDCSFYIRYRIRFINIFNFIFNTTSSNKKLIT